jgi:3-deoxy-D-manno-octulosonic-acid transferase
VLNDRTDLRSIIVPHELKASHLHAIAARVPGPVARWSDERSLPGARTLLIDRMGLLSRSYKYGDIAYVGGGFGSGIHNTLEAAAWGRPVIFGPNHARFAEAKGLIDAGAGFSVGNKEELRGVLGHLLGDRNALDMASRAAARYVRERTGATERIMSTVRALA